MRFTKYERVRVMLGAARRATRRRGHGIHSPFAFDFVRRVIAQPCRYYAYESMRSGSRSERRLTRLLFRLGLFFAPGEIAATGTIEPFLMQWLQRGAEAAADIRRGGPMLVVGKGGSVTDEEMAQIAAREGVIVWLQMNVASGERSSVARLAGQCPHGMLFRGAHTAIYVGLKRLPCQQFDVWI